MKFKFSTKTICSIILGLVSYGMLSSTFADETTINNASDPIASIAAAKTATQPEDKSVVTPHAGTSADTEDALESSNKPNQDAINNMLLQSVSLMGIAYKWGGNTPDTGMDCSGFVRYVFKKSLGINLPRTAAEMAKVGKRISIDQLQPGDLLFFNTRRGSNTHIGIYLGSNKFIQSPRTGETIQITDLSGYWVKHLNGAKRVVEEDRDQDGETTLESYQNVRDQALPVTSRGTSHQRITTRGRRSHHRMQDNKAHSTTSSKNHHHTTHLRRNGHQRKH